MEYEVNIGVGYVLLNIPKQYYRDIPAKTHQEDRYDVKTGVKVNPVTIVDARESRVFTFYGRECKDELDFYDSVAKKVGGVFQHGVDMVSGGWDERYIELDLPFDKSHINLKEVLDHRVDLEIMGDKLISLGFKISEAKILFQETAS